MWCQMGQTVYINPTSTPTLMGWGGCKTFQGPILLKTLLSKAAPNTLLQLALTMLSIQVMVKDAYLGSKVNSNTFIGRNYDNILENQRQDLKQCF